MGWLGQPHLPEQIKAIGTPPGELKWTTVCYRLQTFTMTYPLIQIQTLKNTNIYIHLKLLVGMAMRFCFNFLFWGRKSVPRKFLIRYQSNFRGLQAILTPSVLVVERQTPRAPLPSVSGSSLGCSSLQRPPAWSSVWHSGAKEGLESYDVVLDYASTCESM